MVDNPKVLVADDKEMNLDVERRMLEKLGCTVNTAINGVEAVSRATVSAYDFIFLDITMPVMDGCEAAVRIRALPGGREACILALTGSDPDEVCAQREGLFDEIVQKPITMDMLRQIITRNS